jgi:enoyl-CoA hydratase/carnithine racemase
VESYEYLTRLVRAVGVSWARKLIATGENVDAETALTIGLVEEVVPSDQISTRMESILSKIMDNSSHAMRQTKKVITECTRDPDLLDVTDTARPMVDSMQSPDFKERTQAFLQKRKAK